MLRWRGVGAWGDTSRASGLGQRRVRGSSFSFLLVHQSSIFLEAALEVTVLLLSARRLIGSGFQRTQAWGGDDVADLEPCEVH